MQSDQPVAASEPTRLIFDVGSEKATQLAAEIHARFGNTRSDSPPTIETGALFQERTKVEEVSVNFVAFDGDDARGDIPKYCVMLTAPDLDGAVSWVLRRAASCEVKVTKVETPLPAGAPPAKLIRFVGTDFGFGFTARPTPKTDSV